MMSRALVSVGLIGAILFGWSNNASAGKITLPEGSAPAPVVSRHFPDRLHEFVWRNWNLVEPAKLAMVVGATVHDITAVAESMGLPPAVDIPKEQKARGYITVIRRNWHLLPYDQLLELLDMTPERLAFTLREDDGVWAKLGSLKPRCEPLRYHPPDEAARHRAAEIKRVVEEVFGDEMRRPAAPRFEFVRQLSDPLPSYCAPKSEDASSLSLRYIYSYFSVFGDPLLNPELDPYPDGLLQRLSNLGINGVWLHVLLRDMAPGGDAFPEFGEGHERRLATLRALVERAKKCGIGVYLYMDEPRAMPPDDIRFRSFFQSPDRAEMAGARNGEYTAMCTSHPAVRQWMSDSLAFIFGEVPDLAGVFTITAAEGLTNCASLGNAKSCPRCKDRTDADIIGEVNRVIAEGVHRGNPKANVLAWDWGWRGNGDGSEIIAQLPKSVWLMSVSEWAMPIDRGGVKTEIGEYALSGGGPGPRATRHWEQAKKAGLKTAAKMQLNNSWELSTVPYLPVMDLVAEHCHNLASANIDGMMLSWSLGGYPSPNLEIAARFRVPNAPRPLAGEGQGVRWLPSVDEVLDSVAVEHYGAEGAPLARKAWTAFSNAFREYPFSIGVVYFCPIQMGPANPLYCEKTGYQAAMTGIPYDDLTTWRGPYPPEVFIAQFEKIAEGWRSGLPLLEAAVKTAPPARREEAQAELRFAEAAHAHFLSVANQSRFVLDRDALADPKSELTDEQRATLRADIRRRLESEITLARRLFTLTRQDSRIGFEAANQYFYVPLDLAEKVVNCRWLLSHCGD